MGNVITPGSETITLVAATIDKEGNVTRCPTDGIANTARISKGHYKIGFSFEFTNPPTVTATQLNSGSTLNTVIVTNCATDMVELKTGDSKGNAADRDFYFMAVEQASGS